MTLSICASCRHRLLIRLRSPARLSSLPQLQSWTPKQCLDPQPRAFHPLPRQWPKTKGPLDLSRTTRRSISSNTDWPHSPEDTQSHYARDADSVDTNPQYASNARAALDPAAVAQHARQRFGDRLPEGALTPEEQAVYERMYGKPLPWSEEHEMTEVELEALRDADGSKQDGLLQEAQNGEWEDVEDALNEEPVELDEQPDDNLRLQRDIEAQLDGDGAEMQTEEGSYQRTHPFTMASRSGTEPATLQIPNHSLAGPTAVLLADVSNKHLDEAAEKTLGGKGLPYGVGTPMISRQMTQKPIPLTASQGRMTSMEADVFMAALAPGYYAAVTSVLVEVRRRLGSSWVESLLAQEGGPRVLDTDAGGAGILAWRDIVQAEWSREHEGRAPQGKSTVLTGSDALRLRASVLLDDTTFLPRLPDYMHVQDPVSEQRKTFDVIIAPYSLWHIKEEHLRKAYVENLWRLLDPRGGVLLLVEKGVPRGFEVIAGARQHLLKDIFAPADGSTRNEPRRNVPGSIIAPCTNHAKCPMYPVHGVSRQRKDYCHFSQRYVRPAYYQRLLGARSRNYDDIKYSYVAVQKGAFDNNVMAADEATNRAFEGYDVHDEDLRLRPGEHYPGNVLINSETDTNNHDKRALTTPPPDAATPHRGTLPRLVLHPLKRQGHVILDVCTPSGTLERWTVTRSFGKQAYRDARKAWWGDLWALGAKQRVPRRVRLGMASEDREKGIDGDVIDGKLSKSKERVKRRKEDKAKGREKARLRRREEKAALGL